MGSWIGAALMVILLAVLIFFAAIVYFQFDVFQDVFNYYRVQEGGEAKIASVMGSIDKTLTTLVAFLTAVVTGILGYLGGSQGKKEAQEEATQAKGAVADIATRLPENSPIMDQVKNLYPKAFGR
jgi:hypothetical protein